jgi:hypothetical protein
MSYASDTGISAALPDLDRVLAVLDTAFVNESLPVDDVRVGVLPPALVGDDGDPILNSAAGRGAEEPLVVEAAGTDVFAHSILQRELAAVDLAQEVGQTPLEAPTTPGAANATSTSK